MLHGNGYASHNTEYMMHFTSRIQSPDTSRAGRVGQRTARRLGGADPAGWDADGFVRAGQNRPSCLPGPRRKQF